MLGWTKSRTLSRLLLMQIAAPPPQWKNPEKANLYVHTGLKEARETKTAPSSIKFLCLIQTSNPPPWRGPYWKCTPFPVLTTTPPPPPPLLTKRRQWGESRAPWSRTSQRQPDFGQRSAWFFGALDSRVPVLCLCPDHKHSRSRCKWHIQRIITPRRPPPGNHHRH